MIRIPNALYDELEALAERNERPIHWEARRAIREYIAKASGKPPPPRPDAADPDEE